MKIHDRISEMAASASGSYIKDSVPIIPDNSRGVHRFHGC